MCGIAGILNFDNKAVDGSLIKKACDVLRHRGPDDEGYFVDGPMGLGHRRLSIIDLSDAGHQPMANEDKTLWLTFNGEIYNYSELTAQLKAAGHVFRSRTDSEVVIHAYEEWGVGCLRRFNGMWGFALWDGKTKKLLLARDRFGVKPVYFAHIDRSFYFASEIKAVLAMAPKAARLGPATLYRFLTTGILDDGPETFFLDIKSLMPAHYLVITEAGISGPERYWDFQADDALAAYDYANPEETFLDLFTDAVRLRLRSDVPVGTCLSGGLDSSSIVALASRQIDRPVSTFSAIYDDPDCDESRFIGIMNKQFSAESFPVYPKPDHLFELLPKIVWFQDTPTTAPGIYSQWHVMQEARGKVKVLLDGQGGDELLGGYWRYFDPYLITLMSTWMKTGKSEHLKLLIKSWRRISELTGRSPSRALLNLGLKRLLQRSISSRLGPMARRSLFLNRAAESRFGGLHSDFSAFAQESELKREPGRRLDTLFDTTLYNDLTRESIPALLHYEDRNSMAFSIEARTPFLDYRLVEFCLGLPFTEKIHEATTKHLMRRAMAGILPPPIADRVDKKGYPTPMARWLREDGCRQAKEILLGPEAEGRRIFNVRNMESSLKAHAEGKADLSWDIWRWLTTEIWFRQFLDKNVDQEAAPPGTGEPGKRPLRPLKMVLRD